MNELVSILIPTYNRQTLISDAIECAINQTYKNLEIIIVDNCSTDNTSSIVYKYAKIDSRIKYFINDKNIGPVLNWEKCIHFANGKYVKILWSDDLINKDFITNTIKVFTDETAFVLTGYEIVNILTNKILFSSKFQYKSYTTNEYIQDVVLYRCYDFPVSPASAIFRLNDLKNSFEINIPNNENLDSLKNGAGNDLLIMLNIAVDSKYKHVSCVNHKNAIFRAHENSFSISNNLDIYYEYARLYFILKNKHLNFLSKYLSKLHIYSIKDQSFQVIYKYAKKNLCLRSNMTGYIFFKFLNKLKFILQIQ